MAAYAATTTLDKVTPTRIGNGPMGVLSGTVNITNYNSVKTENTTITGKFLSKPNLRVTGSVSSNGYLVKWDHTANAFKSFTGAAGALSETANDVNIGTLDFIAVGQLG